MTFMPRLSVLHVSMASVLSVGLSLLSGCATGPGSISSTVTPTTTTAAASFSGMIHGGPNPIVGARVVLYATGDSTGASTGYGVAHVLQEANTISGQPLHADTDGNGNFSFAGGVPCPAGQFAYVVAYGGNTGGNAANPNSVLVSALGSCDTLFTTSNGTTTYNGSYIWINELTTAAAAYALGNFTAVSGDPVNGLTVNIGAPATNNASSGCVANSYYPSCTTTAAAGLAHAFGLATSLVNPNTGLAQTFTNRIMPVPVINTLGNILQSCVNSIGGGYDLSTGAPTSTPTSNDGTNCGKLFSFTSYSVTVNSTTTNHYPADTFSAIVNLAKRPASNGTLWNSTCTTAGGGTTTGAACIFGLAGSNGFYTPTLTASPTDWMIGIVYPSGTGGTGTTCSTSTAPGIIYPYMLTLDINDNVYVVNNDSSSQTCANLIGLHYDGSQIFPGTTGDTTVKSIKFIATDTLGHVMIPNYGTSAIRVVDATTGTLLTSISTAISQPWAVAVDAQNNIWYNTSNTPATTGSVPVIGQYQLAGGSTHASVSYTNNTTVAANVPFNTVQAQGGYQLTLDPNANVWMGGNSSSSPAMVVFPNTGTAASPSYTSSATVIASPSTTGNTSGTGYAAMADGNGVGWMINSNGTSGTGGTATTNNPLYKFTPSPSSTSITSVATTTAVSNSGVVFPKYLAHDGNNVIWTVDNGNVSTNPNLGSKGGLFGFDSASNTTVGFFAGCRPSSVTANTTCGTGSSSSVVYAARGIAIDSTGSVWVPNSTAGNITQIIGIAAPTWPELSLLKNGRP